MSIAAWLCSSQDANWIFVDLTAPSHTAQPREFISFNAAGAQAVTLPAAPADNTQIAVRRDHLGAGAKNVVCGGGDTIRTPNSGGAGTATSVDLSDPGCNAGTMLLVYNASASSWWVLSVA